LDQPLGPRILKLLGLGGMREVVFRFPVWIQDLPPPGNDSPWNSGKAISI